MRFGVINCMDSLTVPETDRTVRIDMEIWACTGQRIMAAGMIWVNNAVFLPAEVVRGVTILTLHYCHYVFILFSNRRVPSVDMHEIFKKGCHTKAGIQSPKQTNDENQTTEPLNPVKVPQGWTSKHTPRVVDVFLIYCKSARFSSCYTDWRDPGKASFQKSASR